MIEFVPLSLSAATPLKSSVNIIVLLSVTVHGLFDFIFFWFQLACWQRTKKPGEHDPVWWSLILPSNPHALPQGCFELHCSSSLTQLATVFNSFVFFHFFTGLNCWPCSFFWEIRCFEKESNPPLAAMPSQAFVKCNVVLQEWVLQTFFSVLSATQCLLLEACCFHGGTLGIILFPWKLCKEQQMTRNGKVQQLACDSDSALHASTCFHDEHDDPKQLNHDTIHTMQSNVASLPIRVIPKQVKGHKEDAVSQDQLAPMEQLNVEMDFKGEHRDSLDESSMFFMLPTELNFSGSGSAFFIGRSQHCY